MAPIAMFNALWFRPDGGRQRYAEYGRSVMPILADVGADVVVPFVPVEQSLEGGFDPDVIGFVRYPSEEAFDHMWRSDAYAEIAGLRTDALDRAVLTRCAVEPPEAPVPQLEPGVGVLNALWFHPGGRERYDEYLDAARPLVEAVGGRFVTPRFLPQVAVQGDFVPDMVFVGAYPSMDDLSALVSSADYQRVAALRTAAVRRSATTTLRLP